MAARSDTYLKYCGIFLEPDETHAQTEHSSASQSENRRTTREAKPDVATFLLSPFRARLPLLLQPSSYRMSTVDGGTEYHTALGGPNPPLVDNKKGPVDLVMGE